VTVSDNIIDLEQRRLQEHEMATEADEQAAVDASWNADGWDGWLARRCITLAVRSYAFDILNNTTEGHFDYMRKLHGDAVIEWAKTILPDPDDRTPGE
jgi:hypothetical protein